MIARRLVSGLPSWCRTVRVRLALTYSALLFGITTLILAGVYVALSRTLVAEPLDPVTVKKFVRAADGTIATGRGRASRPPTWTASRRPSTTPPCRPYGTTPSWRW